MSRHEYSPFERLSGFPGMSALPCGQSRRLARSGGSLFGGVATDLGQCSNRINPAESPPAPPHDGNPAAGGQTGRGKGRSIVFCNDGVWGVCQKPGEIVVTNLQSHVAVRTPPPRVNVQYPRVVRFSPRVWSFSPRVGFCRFAAPTVSLSLSSLVKERERGSPTGDEGIHGFFGCLKKHPRVCRTIHGFSGDEKTGKTQYWRGFAGFLTPIHASTGRNAYTPLTKVRNDH